MINVQNLTKTFGNLTVLNDVSLEIGAGKIVAVLGPNGSGKTTLIKCLMGMVRPDKGGMYLKGEQINDQSSYRTYIDYLPQISRHPENLTPRELVRMLGDIRQQPAREEVFVDLFELEPYLDKRLKNLSGGTRQKVSIMLSLMFHNDLLIMDEPTNGLDPTAIIRLKDYLLEKRRENKSIIFTTHIIPLVEEMAEEIIFLLEGNIYFQGSVDELKKQQSEPNLERAIAHALTTKKASI
ncbi:MAG: ABC transporter ATP-binding protein [Cyclobacteriaceae bacterium]|nr:ABC transporter ATP-binding protein [Cyclobacteriaceae bacterium]